MIVWPLYQNHFWPWADFCMTISKSASVLSNGFGCRLRLMIIQLLQDRLISRSLLQLGDVMVERNNSLNNTYRQYDSEMNAQHNIDLIHPPMPIASQPQQCMVNPQLKIAKEDLERGLLLVSLFSSPLEGSYSPVMYCMRW